MANITTRKTNKPTETRFKQVDQALKRLQFQQDALIEMFHTVQEAFRCLGEDLLIYTGHSSTLLFRWAYIPVEGQVLNPDGELAAEVIRE